jgi:hypothetical protein
VVRHAIPATRRAIPTAGVESQRQASNHSGKASNHSGKASNPSDEATIPECQGCDRRPNAILPGSQVSIRIDKGAILARDAGGSRLARVDSTRRSKPSELEIGVFPSFNTESRLIPNRA